MTNLHRACLGAVLASCAATLAAPPASAAPRKGPRDPSPVLRPDWVLLQFVPSPGVADGQSGAQLTLRWQVTPLLYSFGTDRRLNRWRWFIAEPLYRHAGSVEFFTDPYYIGRSGHARDRWGVNTGMRAHFPWIQRGDYLSWSVGSSLLWLHEGVQPSFEAGVSTLFGVFGVFLHVAPWFDDGRFELSLRVRWF